MLGQIIQILYVVLVIFSVFVVIIENRDPAKTLCWVLAILMLPGAGMILYIFIGKDHRHVKAVPEKERKLISSLKSASVEGFEASLEAGNFRNVAAMLSNTADSKLLHSNSVEVYTDFSEMFDALCRHISAAKHHIHIQFFKVEDDAIGNELANLLIEKASSGVEVRLLYDDVGNFQVRRKFYQRMIRGGVEVYPFMKVRFPFPDRDINCRNHRKIVVIDGEYGFIGGMNIAQRYKDGIKSGIWRDTHIMVKGPVVMDMQEAFVFDWRFAAKELLDSAAFFPKAEASGGNMMMQVATSGPMEYWQVIMQGMVQAIASAKEYVYIQSPYFIPSEPFMVAVCNAALAGVDVRIMVPKTADRGIFVAQVTRSYFGKVLRAGVKIYSYTKGYLHSKTMIVDDSFCTIGSTNIDFRSFEQNFEANAFIYDHNMATKMKDIFLADQKDTIQETLEAWLARPWYARFLESSMRLIAPML